MSARDRDKDRGVDLSGYAWEDDPVALARRDDVDVFVELMGGSDGPAKAATEAALAAGKDVVTANKAMLAHHGQALAEAAEAAGRVIRFEAAVAGGIPVIKALTEGLAGNEITRVMGVMNGTCNYILTRMESAGLPYDDGLRRGRRAGLSGGRPDAGRGRHRRGPQAGAAGRHRLRHAGRFRRGRARGDRADLDRGYPRRPPTWATGSSCWAWRR